MQVRFKELQEALEEMKTMRKKEYVLTMAVCILLGMVVGMFFSPKKRVTIGSNNGNNSGNGIGYDEDDCCDCDEECGCGDECDCGDSCGR